MNLRIKLKKSSLIPLLTGFTLISLLAIPAYAEGPSFRRALIQQSDTGKCLTAKKSKKIYVRRCADKKMAKRGGKAQRWTLKRNGQLFVSESGKCLQPKKGKVKKGKELVLGKCNSKNKRQLWDIKNGRIVHRKSGLCIEGRGKKLLEDNDVELFKCKKKDKTQIWAVYGQRIGAFKKVKSCDVPTDKRLNDVFLTRAHNAYESKHFRRFKDAVNKWDVVEIDLTPAKSGVWVSHAHNRHENNCGKKGNANFKTCLRDLRSWHNKNPRHRPKLVVLNLKLSYTALPKKFKEKHMAAFEKSIYSVIGKNNLYRPVDRRGTHPNLQQALRKSAWPTLNELRGKFIFLVNAGPALPPTAHANKTLNRYIEKFGYQAAAFACPFPRDADDLVNRKKWKYIEDNARHVACLTVQFDEDKGLKKIFSSQTARQRARSMLMDIWNPVGIAESVFRTPCVKKGSACADDPRGFNTLVKSGASTIGTNFPESAQWARNGRRGMTKCIWNRGRPKHGIFKE